MRVSRLAFENNMEREAVICSVFLELPKSTYKAPSPSFINNVSTKAFEKMIVDICLVWFKCSPVLALFLMTCDQAQNACDGGLHITYGEKKYK